MAVVRTHNDEITGDRRCADDFGGDLRGPAFGAVARAKGLYAALERADDDKIPINTRPSGETHGIVAMVEHETAAFASLFVPQAAAGRSVERFDRAGSARGVEFAVGICRPHQRTGLLSALADARGPHALHRDAIVEVLGQRRRRFDVFLLYIVEPAFDRCATAHGHNGERERTCAQQRRMSGHAHEPFFSAPPRSLSFISTKARFGAPCSRCVSASV